MRRISPLSWLLIVVGLAFLVLGVIYLTITGPNLPSFIPGHVGPVKNAGHYNKRGVASLAVAVAAFVGVYYKDFRQRQQHRGSGLVG
jgi:amino acid permease